MILALAGGVGGARLAWGLARALQPAELAIVVNVGDDFEHLGLHVSPDLDTVMYTLAGLHNPVTGWGRSDETWNFMEVLDTLGGETWFRLGDRDLAVHVERTRRMAAGETLSQVTEVLCRRLGIGPSVMPVTDDRLRTMVVTREGELSFQHYFVRRRCEPRVCGFRFEGAEEARLSAPLARLIGSSCVTGVVLCPSNPWLSIAPMRTVPALEEFLSARRVPVIAVSPIVGGAAVKGPAAKIMRELGREPSALEIVRHYGASVDGWLIDRVDAALAAQVVAMRRRVRVADTMMTDADRSLAVAREALALLGEMRE